MKRFAAALFLAAAICGEASAQDVAAAVARAETLIAENRFDEAAAILSASQKEAPGNYARDFLLIRATAWSGDHAGALRMLDDLETQHGANSDTMMFRGHILRYKGDFAAAEAQFRNVLAAYPGSEEARAALETYFPPETSEPPQPRERASGRPRWRVDTGFEISTFQRRDMENWNQQYFSAAYAFPARRLGVHGTVRRYEQFSLEDYEVEVGVNAAPSRSSALYAALWAAPDTDFRPEWRISAGGAIRLVKGFPASEGGVWATADLRYDWYETVEILTANPGLRIAVDDAWGVRARMIAVAEIDGATAFGWDARLDGRFCDGWRFFAGLADAPETVAAETVRTFSVFGGSSIDLTDRLSLNFSYTRDDRENSYIREAYHAGIAVRF